MRKKTPYLILWHVSLLFLIVALILFAILLVGRWRYPVFGFCAIGSAVLFAILFLICRKPLQCDDGYSLQQAITYYTACKKAGCEINTLQENEQLLLQTAIKENMEDYDIQQLQNCFKTGAKAVREIRNPLLQLIWGQKKTNKTGKRKRG